MDSGKENNVKCNVFALGTEISKLGQQYSSIYHKKVTNEWILEFKVSKGPYWSVLY